jgi:hypothetical protein
MKKSTEAALCFGLGYVLLRTGIAIWRHPVGSAIVLTAFFIAYAFDAPSPWEALHSAIALATLYALVFIVGLACSGRGLAAFLWFVALMSGVNIIQAWIECTQNTCYYAEPHWYASTRSPDGHYVSNLGDFHWWFHHDGLLPQPAVLAAAAMVLILSILEEVFAPRQTNDVVETKPPSMRAEWFGVRGMWWHRQECRPPPTFDDVLRVAEVLSRINADLIERQFTVGADVAKTFMDRLVEEEQYGQIGPDGWHYPLTRKERLRRSREQRKTAAKSKILASIDGIGDAPDTVADLNKRIGELEQQGRALRARVKRLQFAGKTLIDQREEWKARALAAEATVAQLPDRAEFDGGMFNALRRLVAKELHPDLCTGGDLEKTLRAAFFKKLWPEIQRITERPRT